MFSKRHQSIINVSNQPGASRRSSTAASYCIKWTIVVHRFYIRAPKRQSGVKFMISSFEDLNTAFRINKMALSMTCLDILCALRAQLITVTLENLPVYRSQ
jgi:hypothetical protein